MKDDDYDKYFYISFLFNWPTFSELIQVMLYPQGRTFGIAAAVLQAELPFLSLK